MERLEKFCSISGQKVNLQKSSIAFSRNVKEDVAKRISEISKISVTTKLEKYLDVPSITGHVHVGLFQHVLDKVEGILDGWEVKLLSLAGRITLAQLVLNSIPLYSMQSTMLHIALCNNLDKKVRQIIWGSLQGYQKIHLVNWEMVTQQR